MDLEMMRRLHKKVNIVIVITKADTLTQTEVKRLKANILRDVEANGIQLYRFPECDSDEDEDFKRQDSEMKQSIPFAVVGSNTIFEVGGKKFRGRQYPWGVVDGNSLATRSIERTIMTEMFSKQSFSSSVLPFNYS